MVYGLGQLSIEPLAYRIRRNDVRPGLEMNAVTLIETNGGKVSQLGDCSPDESMDLGLSTHAKGFLTTSCVYIGETSDVRALTPVEVHGRNRCNCSNARSGQSKCKGRWRVIGPRGKDHNT